MKIIDRIVATIIWIWMNIGKEDKSIEVFFLNQEESMEFFYS